MPYNTENGGGHGVVLKRTAEIALLTSQNRKDHKVIAIFSEPAP